MPFKSEKQRKWMHATKPEMAKKWEKEKKDESLSGSQAKAAHDKFKKTGELPPHLKKLVKKIKKFEKDANVKNIVVPGLEWMSKIKEETKRDYKDEYKKFQSSTKSKKYRAELNKYNRKKGTYGNGDGKDASHKGGKIAGFEKESTNRGRREKSRLKKESPDFNPMIDKILDEVIDEYQINEGTNQMTQVYKDLDKKFKNYDHTRIQHFGKVSKYLKTKFSKDSGLPDAIASFYNDYRGGEDMKKNIAKLTKYAKKMKGYAKESVNERRQYKSGGQEMNFIVQQLVKYGNTKSDAIKMTRKHYNHVIKRYRNSHFIPPVKKAEIISSLSANESVNEYSGMSKWQKDRLDQRSKEKAPKGKKVSKALHKKQDAWAKKYYTKGGGINIAKWKKDGSPGFPKESVNEAGMEMNKLKDAIKMFQKKIEKQGRVTNARDEEHLSNLIKLYIQMGGKGIKESDLGLTYKKGKTVKVRHKTSGKSIIIIDKPNVRKEYEKIGFYAEGFGGDLKGNDKKKFEKARKENAEQLGYELTGKSDIRESVNEGQKKFASKIVDKFDQAFLKFSREVRDVIKMMDRSTGSKVDGKIIDKAYSKGLIPLDKLMKSWDRGQQSNPKIDEKVIKVSKKDDVPGNAMKMSGEEKIKKLTYSGSNGTGSYEIKGKNLNVIGIRPRDKGFFVRHFTMKTGFRKANLYYDGVSWMDKNKKF